MLLFFFSAHGSFQDQRLRRDLFGNQVVKDDQKEMTVLPRKAPGAKYLNRDSLEPMVMNLRDLHDMHHEKGYRIRCMKSLIGQIKRDHAHFKRLCERLEKGETDFALIQEVQGVLSWLKQGLDVFKEMRKAGIEGVSWGEISQIDQEIKDKELHLKLFLYSISMETENIHSSHSLFKR